MTPRMSQGCAMVLLLAMMLAIAAGVAFEAVLRFDQPVEVKGAPAAVIALIGLALNIAVLRWLSPHAHDMNTDAARLHVVGDVLGSAAALVAGALIALGGPSRIDPAASLLICVLIAMSSLRLLREGLHALMEAVPAGLSVDAIGAVPDVITPFPGGIVRSGSKVGSKYKGAIASTNDAFCPTLRGRVKSELGPDTVAVLEIVIDGLTSKAVANAMRAGLKSVIEMGAAKGVTRVTAGNYGGKLGQHHYHLRELLP